MQKSPLGKWSPVQKGNLGLLTYPHVCKCRSPRKMQLIPKVPAISHNLIPIIHKLSPYMWISYSAWNVHKIPTSNQAFFSLYTLSTGHVDNIIHMPLCMNSWHYLFWQLWRSWRTTTSARVYPHQKSSPDTAGCSHFTLFRISPTIPPGKGRPPPSTSSARTLRAPTSNAQRRQSSPHCPCTAPGEEQPAEAGPAGTAP